MNFETMAQQTLLALRNVSLASGSDMVLLARLTKRFEAVRDECVTAAENHCCKEHKCCCPAEIADEISRIGEQDVKV